MFRYLKPLRYAPRSMQTSSNVKNKLDFATPPQGKQFIIEPLEKRDLVRVSGEEVVPFLQGLVTNDMKHLHAGTNAMYTMFLNNGGRVLYDSIVYRTPEANTYLVECDKQVSNELSRHLRTFRVRRKIAIDVVDQQYRPWTVFDNNAMEANTHIEVPKVASDVYIITTDPRLRDLGLRIITTPDIVLADLAKYFSKSNEAVVEAASEHCNYRLHRYRHGVGEGIQDLPPGKCFPLEANCDFMHGVSFHKGCYVGQELTARVHHTGIVRKRLMPLKLTKPISEQTTSVKTPAGAAVGTIRGSILNRALALLRVEQVLQVPHLLVDEDPCYTEKPKWWPTELPKKASLPA